MPVQFGTSGWRALYHGDLTFENIDAVIQAVAQEVLRGGHRSVCVGYDVRFMGRDFGKRASEIFAANGLACHFSERDVPTPALSYAIIQQKWGGGVNFTASHNPYEYNGIKYSPETGGPALPEATARIERDIALILAGGKPPARDDFQKAVAAGRIIPFDARLAYFEGIKTKVRVAALALLGGKRIAVDCKNSVARGYLDRFLTECGIQVHVIHGDADPYFGHDHPEPAAGHVDALQAYVRQNDDVVLGLACDGDADRFGVVDGDGTFFEANLVVALLLNYLAPSRQWKGAVARSVATTHLIDAVAKRHGLKTIETPVGFKYIGDLLTKKQIVFGAEESAGLTIDGHIPEKDGILACLLVAEMVASTGKSLAALRDELFAAVVPIYDQRRALKLTVATAAAFQSKISAPPKDIAGRIVTKIDGTDGTKLYLGDGEWVLLRKSGTEPVVRLYAEAGREARIPELLAAVEDWLLGT